MAEQETGLTAGRARSAEVSRGHAQGKDAPPVFNKRLFASQGVVIITQEAKKIMINNAKMIDGDEGHALSKAEMLSMRAVVDGLSLIHKNKDYIKDVLSHVVTLEKYDQFEYIHPKPWEDRLSCYYIVSGATEVTYDVENPDARNVYQPHITYNHGTGEYLGLVNAEGIQEDIAPPTTVLTREATQFLRIDRQKFHRIVQKNKAILWKELSDYIYSDAFFLRQLSDKAKDKLFSLTEKQEYGPNKIVLKQGEVTDFVFIVKSGRCECFRKVHVPEANLVTKLYVTCREQDDFFGEECLLTGRGSYAEIRTTSLTIVYKIPRLAFEVMKGDNALELLNSLKHEDFPSDGALGDHGYRNTLWNNYKFFRVKESLYESDKTRLMWTSGPCPVAERPPTAREQYKENMYRFIMKGSQMEPYKVRTGFPPRPQTAPPTRLQGSYHKVCRQVDSALRWRRMSRPVTAGVNKPNQSHPNRPATAVGLRSVDVSSADTDTSFNDEDGDGDDSPSEGSDDDDAAPSLTDELAKVMKVLEAKESPTEEDINQILESDSELGRRLQKVLNPKKVTEKEKEGFMKSGVLASMKSEDIVRKAMAMVDNQGKRRKKTQANEWSTVLHTENSQAKVLISVNQSKINVLRKKMDDINKARSKERLAREKLRQPHPSVITN